MQADWENGAPRSAARARAASAAAAVVLCAVLLAGAASAIALPARRACAAPSPGRAACMAERLLLDASPGTAGAAPRTGAPGGGGPAADKPFAGYLTPQLLHEAYALPSETPEAPAQTIAIVDAFDDPSAEADLAVFDAQFS
ncbi:MAG: hypothetical protein ACYDC2_08000, partial [Solirubrobacteraceae bacterium]